jgi:hypothetical protein
VPFGEPEEGRMADHGPIGWEGVCERFNGRTGAQILAEYCEPTHPPVVAGGELGGLRYTLDAAPEEEGAGRQGGPGVELRPGQAGPGAAADRAGSPAIRGILSLQAARPRSRAVRRQRVCSMSTDPADRNPSQSARPSGLSYLERALRWSLLSVFVLVPIASGVQVIVTGHVGPSRNQEPVELSPVVAWGTGAAMIAVGVLFLYLVVKAIRLKSAGGLASLKPRPRLARWLTALMWVSLAGLLVGLVSERDWWGVATLVVIVSGLVFAGRMNRVQGQAQPGQPPGAPDPPPQAPGQGLGRGEPGAEADRPLER